MVEVPEETPVTSPEASTVATAGVPLRHDVPPTDSPNVVTLPTQTLNVPVSAAGIASTVNETIAEHPPIV